MRECYCVLATSQHIALYFLVGLMPYRLSWLGVLLDSAVPCSRHCFAGMYVSPLHHTLLPQLSQQPWVTCSRTLTHVVFTGFCTLAEQRACCCRQLVCHIDSFNLEGWTGELLSSCTSCTHMGHAGCPAVPGGLATCSSALMQFLATVACLNVLTMLLGS